MDLDRERLQDAYRRMRTIHAFEEKLSELVTAGELAGFLHLYAGEEAVAGSGHAVSIEAPDALNTALANHLAALA